MPGAHDPLGQDLNSAGIELSAFLFTDIEGSTQRWERAPEAMRSALARHDALLRSAIEGAGGRIFKSAGNSFCALFTEVAHALTAAIGAQRLIAADGFSEVGGLKVRMAVDAGEVDARDGDYFGRPLNRVARLLAAGHGGQVLVSTAAAELVRDALPPGSSLIRLGVHHLRDFAEPQEIHQLAAPDLPSCFPCASHALNKSRKSSGASHFVCRPRNRDRRDQEPVGKQPCGDAGWIGRRGKDQHFAEGRRGCCQPVPGWRVVCRTCSADQPTPHPRNNCRPFQCANRHWLCADR